MSTMCFKLRLSETISKLLDLPLTGGMPRMIG
jgi:hypothetical protein